MTSRSFSLQSPERGIDGAISPARLAAEAFFSATPIAKSGDRPAPQVIVKRRRKLDVELQDGTAEALGSTAPEERAPRTHLLSSPAQPSPEGPRSDEADPLLGQERQPRRLRRTRRSLNGTVTIIRPELDEAGLDAKEPDRPVKHSPAVLQPTSDLPPSMRYPRLLAQIRALEQEALQLKQRESMVRWIARAIRQYELTASDVGF